MLLRKIFVLFFISVACMVEARISGHRRGGSNIQRLRDVVDETEALLDMVEDMEQVRIL